MKCSEIQSLLDVMVKLRGPKLGCPWDIVQSYSSIVIFTLEEAYEVADTIEHMTLDELSNEQSNLLFEAVFYCKLGKDRGLLGFGDVVDKICNKLTSEHFHVFGFLKEASTAQVKLNWESMKAKERKDKSLDSVLDNIPLALSTLTRSVNIQQCVARVGFDWDDLGPVVAKIKEEIDEVLYEVRQELPLKNRIQDEMGDLLFAVTNLARHLDIEPEQALCQANAKFERRFRGVEILANSSGKSLEEHSLIELDAYWDQVKRNEMHK
ncbi:MAG: nucleoside triphosphate pyrophosphohydrolase [Shewanella sp.]